VVQVPVQPDDTPPEVTDLAALELLRTELEDDGIVTEVIRPAAIIPETAARLIVRELEARSPAAGGVWTTTTREWNRWQAPGVDEHGHPTAPLLGRLEVAYGTPTRYEITIYRATLTSLGTAAGWTVEDLCDEPLALGGLRLSTCPRASLRPPPKPFRFGAGRAGVL
jgi:hypothetical protein